MIFTRTALAYYLACAENQLLDGNRGYVSSLSPEARRLRDRRLPRRAIRRYKDSAFRYLYESGDDQSLVNVTGCTHAVFNGMLQLFKPFYEKYRPNLRTGEIEEIKKTNSGKIFGRRRDLDAVGCLGLVLLWYRTRGALSRSLAITFGLTYSPMLAYLKFGRRILLAALQDDPYAAITVPTEEEVKLYSEAIAAKYPPFKDKKVWGAADGLKLPIESVTDDRVQNYFYNGWLHGHYINSVFVFAADGRIRIATVNAPGSWHDSTIADYGIYKKIDSIYDQYNASVVVDSAFQLGSRPCLVKSTQQDPIGDAFQVSLNCAATSVRQLSEWGMRMIQSQFPRLRDAMKYEETGERRIIMHLMMHIYNYTCSYVGFNQILNSYMEQNLSGETVNYYGEDFAVSADANDFVNGNM